MNKIGGRKFLAMILMTAAGMALEFYTKNGLTPVMAGFLAGLVAVYTGGNALTSRAESAQGAPIDMTELEVKLDGIRWKLDEAVSGENTRQGMESLAEMGRMIGDIAQSVNSTNKLLLSALGVKKEE